MSSKRQAATDEQAAVIGYVELAGKTASNVVKLVVGFDPESVVRAGWDSAIELIDEAQELLGQARRQAESGRELCHPELEFTAPVTTGEQDAGADTSAEKPARKRRAANG